MNNFSLVTVIIRFCDRTQYIAQAIESVARQDYGPKEIIIVNDGEVEKRKNIKAYVDSGTVKIVYSGKIGRSAALNYGIKMSSGKYLVFLDDDDLLHPQMLSQAVRLAEETQIDMVSVGYWYFKREEECLKNPERFISGRSHNIAKELAKRNPWPINTILVKKEKVEDVGCFNSSLLACEDWDLWFRLFLAGAKIEFLDKCLSFIRIHTENISRDTLFMRQAGLKVIEKIKEQMDVGRIKESGINWIYPWQIIVTGWYVVIDGRKGEGRRQILKSVRINFWYILHALVFGVVSFLPLSFLKKTTFFLEKLFCRINRYE